MENFRLEAGSSSEDDSDNPINERINVSKVLSSLSSAGEESDDDWLTQHEEISSDGSKKKKRKSISRIGKIDFQRKQQKQPPSSAQRRRGSRSPSPQPNNKIRKRSGVFQDASNVNSAKNKKRNNNHHSTDDSRNIQTVKKQKNVHNSITFNNDFDYMSSLMIQDIVPPPSMKLTHHRPKNKSNGENKETKANSSGTIVDKEVEDITVLVDPNDEKKSYVLLFQDDGTETRKIGSRVLNFSFGLIESISDWTIEQVYQQLMNEGAKEEAKRVQIRSTDHLRKIIENVRFQFQHRNISKKYLVLADAFVVPEPKLKEGIAMKNKELINNHHKIMIREEELKSLHDELNEARKIKNELQYKLQKLKEETNKNDNEYLSKYISSDKLKLNQTTNHTIPSSTTASPMMDDPEKTNSDIEMMMKKNANSECNEKTMVFISPTNNNIVQNFINSFKSPYDQYDDETGE